MKNWEKAGLVEVVRSCSNVTKDDEIEVIDEGAETVELVMEETRMKYEGGSARECRGIVQALLDAFLTAVKRMKCG